MGHMLTVAFLGLNEPKKLAYLSTVCYSLTVIILFFKIFYSNLVHLLSLDKTVYFTIWINYRGYSGHFFIILFLLSLTLLWKRYTCHMSVKLTAWEK